MSASEIISHGDKLFSQRSPILFHWQEIAEHFHYDRATFSVTSNIGTDYAANSMSSVAALARREMGNMYRTMLRPKNFFALGVEGMMTFQANPECGLMKTLLTTVTLEDLSLSYHPVILKQDSVP
mgnify:CR=1 FL=1